ncbi:MAG: D-tyrosyl-tRNA(Tyr) deacylase [Crocinitomicaceae bacterium]|nr:D-tyrosyl-tRNA(Tyr) deacylase [Crocinitomicaceae bacterium]|tara:strand:- start:5951 stop:6400 length:450 start_codon:yes stop_codon:yes gene_type:complete
MRLVLQRVKKASVFVDNRVVGEIGLGLLVLLGVEQNDDKEDVLWLVKKLLGIRVLSDENGKMNLSLKQVNGSVLVVSQFTLHASTKKGNRPSYMNAAEPKKANEFYEEFILQIKNEGVQVQTGVFGANMQVELINDGPVTIVLDSKNKE